MRGAMAPSQLLRGVGERAGVQLPATRAELEFLGGRAAPGPAGEEVQVASERQVSGAGRRASAGAPEAPALRGAAGGSAPAGVRNPPPLSLSPLTQRQVA